jgi:TonB-linked SusC/RagA family outer membrane protein
MQKIIAFAKWTPMSLKNAKLSEKIRFIMRVSVGSCMMLAITVQLFASGITRGQDIYETKVNLHLEKQSLKSALARLQDQSGFAIFYPTEKVDVYKEVSLKDEQRTVAQTLRLLLVNTNLEFKQQGAAVVLFEKILTVSAQDPKLLIGKVLDDANKTLPGVTVKVKGASTGQTVTNVNGEFSILVIDDNATLVFSFIGFITKEIPAKGLKNPVTIIMKQDIGNLDEVQITAYGKTTKRLNTGNQVTFRAEDITKNAAPNVLQAMQGHIPGLFITQQSGQPGRPFDIKIRGLSTISTGGLNVYPLIIVDGVAYPGANLPFLSGNLNANQRGGNGLSYLNPEMIESIDVLKDADATSIYGSRGAYGVILITTKKGKAGAPILSLNTEAGLTYRGTTPKLLNIDDYLMLRREAFKNDGVEPGANDLDLNGTWPLDRNTNWTKEFFRDRAITTNTYATYSGGTENINYLVGGNYNRQNNIARGKGAATGGGLNFNLNASSLNKKFNITLGGVYTTNVNTIAQYELGASAALFTPSVTSAPNAPLLFNPDGSLNFTDYEENPASSINMIYKNLTNNLIANTQLTYNLVKGLTLNAGFSYNVLSGRELRALPSTYFNPNTTYLTESSLNLYNISTWTFEPNAKYTTTLGKKGNLAVTVGGTMQNNVRQSNGVTGYDFQSDALLYNPTFTNTDNITTSFTEVTRKYLGYLGIINYNWDGKYIINFSGRYDGSSKFGHDKQFGAFGSVGAAYIISEEPWFKNNISFINIAKLRGSYGSQGGDAINDYAYLSTYINGIPYQGELGTAPNKLANPALQWETNRKTDVSITLDFFKSRISIDATYYNNITGNQLIPQPLSTVTGFDGITINRDARIRNYGYEFILNTKNIISNKLRWTSSINFTLPHNVLQYFPDIATSGGTYEIGKSVQYLKLYKYVGVNPETGFYNFENSKGVVGTFGIFDPVQLDQKIDKTEGIDMTPRFYGGFSNTVSYQNFTLNFTFSFSSQYGRSYLGSQNNLPGGFNNNVSVETLRRWQKPGDITDIPKVTQSLLNLLGPQAVFLQSTGAYTLNTYARLNNVSLYYAFPKNLVQRAHLSGLSIFLKGQNLLTISKYGGLDPENLGAGLAPLRVVTGGINLTL